MSSKLEELSGVQKLLILVLAPIFYIVIPVSAFIYLPTLAAIVFILGYIVCLGVLYKLTK